MPNMPNLRSLQTYNPFGGVTSRWGEGIAGYAFDPGDIMGSRSGQRAAEQQQAAQEHAKAQSLALLEGQRVDLAERQAAGEEAWQQGTAQGVGAVQQGAVRAGEYYDQGLNRSAGAIGSGYSDAQRRVLGLQGMQGPQAYDLQGQYAGQLGQLQGQQAGLSGIDQRVQMDPGMEFRRQQGEQAINRSAAAQGGRLGGATLKALAEYNQGLASQEYGNAYNRALSTQAQGFGQQAQIAGLGLQAMTNQAGRSDAMAQYGQQRQDTLGLAGAEMSVQGGRDMSNLYGSYAANQAGNATQAGNNIGQMYYGQGQGIAGLGAQYGQMQSDTTLGMIQAEQNAAQYAGMQQQAQANAGGQRAGLIGGVLSLISDRHLKTDIRDGDRDARDLLDAIGPSVFRYIDPQIAHGDMLGVMAQDLERSDIGKTMVVETEIGKAIDPMRAISALLAVVAHLNQRVATLEGR